MVLLLLDLQQLAPCILSTPSDVFTRPSSMARRATGDKTLRLWALSDGSCLKTFEGHTASVLRLNFLSAGTQVS